MNNRILRWAGTLAAASALAGAVLVGGATTAGAATSGGACSGCHGIFGSLSDALIEVAGGDRHVSRPTFFGFF